MPLDYNDPAVIQFLKETYDKENEHRTLWFLKNKEGIIARTSSSNKQKEYRTEDIARAYIEPLMPNLAKHNEVCWPNRLRKALLDNPLISAPERKKIYSDEKENLQEVYSGAIMMPVDPEVTKILNDALPYGGRKQYLNKRFKVIPEEKYYFCETSSNVCGWRIKNSKLGYLVSDCRRKAIFFQNLISRSGPQPDPPHYKEITNYSKCTT